MAISTAIACPAAAGSGDLRDFISDLYGGDGIQTVTTIGAIGADFEASSLLSLGRLSEDIGSSFQSISTRGGGSSYIFDFELGVPVESSKRFGSLAAESAETIGARRLALGASYTRVDYKIFDGERVSDLSVSLPSADLNGDGQLGPPGSPIELDRILVDLDLEIRQELVALQGKYGITDNWDAEVVVPIVHTTARSHARATVVCNSISAILCTVNHQIGPPGSDPALSSAGGTKTGVGDVLLRTKYNFTSHLMQDTTAWPDIALRGQIRVPSGNKRDLLGKGETDFQLLAIFSKTWRRLAPHMNLGYEVSTGPSDFDNLRYVVGFEALAHQRLTLGIDVLGRYSPHANRAGEHLVDIAIGGRWNIWRALLFNANFQVPVNRSRGLRPDLIWTLGFEYNFTGG